MDSATNPSIPVPTRSARAERYPRVGSPSSDPDVEALHHAILSGPRREVAGQFPIQAADGTLEGPFGLFLFAPALGAPWQQLGTALRTATSLSDRERELATLAVAAEMRSDVELRAHVPLASAAGIDDGTIATVLRGRPLEDPRERALVQFCRANAVIMQPQPEFDELTVHYGRRAVFEIVSLVAYYRGLAAMLSLFGVEPPAGSPPAPVEPLSTTETSVTARDLALWRDEREITRVLLALARHVDSFDFDGLAALYAEDGELITPASSHRGRAGLADFARADLGGFRALHHVSAGHEVWVVPGADRARARMTLLATHVSDGDGRVFSAAGGHYDIDLIREHGRWRLARVRIHPAWRFDTPGATGAP